MDGIFKTVSVVCGEKIASKGLPGTLKPFLRTLKRVSSTFGMMLRSFHVTVNIWRQGILYLKYDNLKVEALVNIFDGSLRFIGWNETWLHLKRWRRVCETLAVLGEIITKIEIGRRLLPDQTTNFERLVSRRRRTVVAFKLMAVGWLWGPSHVGRGTVRVLCSFFSLHNLN